MTESAAEVENINLLIGRLNSDRRIDLKLQLLAGADTAAINMLVLLKNLPRIIEFHIPGYGANNMAETAQRSVGLSWRLALTCVNRLMAAQAALGGNDEWVTWAGLDVDLDPIHFKVSEAADGVATVQYAGFNKLEVPTGYHAMLSDPLPRATKIGDIACRRPNIIGCPITLLPGRTQELWASHVDVVERQGLWQTDATKK